MIIPVILSGGSGTRLWPLSTPEKPKQFLALTSARTMFQETLLRLEGIDEIGDPIVVCNEQHGSLVASQLEDIGKKAQAIVLEPEGRNTAPAIAIAAALALRADSGSDPTLLVLPADHVILDSAAFCAAVADAVAAARAGRLVTFGVVPSHPETGYGYIEQGASEGASFSVKRFVEKPDIETARAYLDSGGYLWNSGMFVFGAASFLDELAQHAPAIRSACESAAAHLKADGRFDRLGPDFLDCPSDSVDYAVMEKTETASVVPLDAGWSDVGSWSALCDVLPKDDDGNVMQGEAVALDSGNSLVISDSRKVMLLGLDDVVVIDDEKAVLVMRKDASQDLKRLLEKLKEDDRDA